MLNKNNLLIAKGAASEGDSKYSISGVLVEPGATVVTDGHLMLVVETPEFKVEDFPKFNGQTLPAEDFKPFVIPAKTALEIVKSIPKSKIPILEHAVIVCADSEKSEVGVTDLEIEKVFRTKAGGGIYPNWRAVVQRAGEPPAIEVSIEISQLVDAMTMLKAMGIMCATFRFQDGKAAFRFDGIIKDTGQHVTGVLMPMNPISVKEQAKDWSAPAPVAAPAKEPEVPAVPEVA